MKYLFLIFFIFISFYFAFASEEIKKNEKYYQNIFCEKLDGITEYRLKDKTRVDCLTNEYAIEVDWANKWAEGVGQSLYYAIMTKKKPALALIVSNKDQRYIKRVKVLSNKYNIRLFIIER